MYSSLKRKTPLKAKTPLRAKTSLKAYGSLKPSGTLRSGSELKVGTSKKTTVSSPKRKTAVYVPSYPYESIFTKDLNRCLITGSAKPEHDIHVHHIFGAANKANSEKYHFLMPLRADWHDMADYGIHFNEALDLRYKRKCQEYWLQHYGTKEEFIEIFNQWW